MSNKRTPVPVLMFHSVRPVSQITSHLSIPLHVFEQNMRALADNGYTTITLRDLYDYVSSGKSLPPKAICLTFDDGFLDNWVFAFPVLKKFGLKATIFPVIDFLDVGPTRSLYEVGMCNSSNLEYLGSLRWSELLKMESSRVFDVQSHTMTHSRLFKNSNLKEFVSTEESYPWLAWNLYPSKKINLFESTCNRMVPLGYPIFEYDRALSVRKYIPNDEFVKLLTDYVASNGELDFFQSPSWRIQLGDIVKDWVDRGNVLGVFESKDENRIRIEHELVQSKKILEERLSKKIEFLCWPGGGRTVEALHIAKDIGYIATTIPSAESSVLKNIPGEDPFQIKRIGTCSTWSFKKMYNIYGGPKYFLASIDAYRSIKYAETRRKVMKLAMLLKRVKQVP